MKKFKDQFQLPDISPANLKKIFPTKDNFIWLSSDRENIAYKLKNNILVNSNELHSFRSQFLSLLFEVKKTSKLIVWQELNEHLNHIISLRPIIVKDKEVVAELSLIQKYLHDNTEFSYLLPGMEMKLKLILPKEMPITQKIRQPEEKDASLSLLIRNNYKTPSTKIMPENVIEWFIDPAKGSLFNPKTIDKNITVKPKRIKIKEFLAAIGSVAEEIILSQYSFEKPLENLVKVLKLDLSGFPGVSLSKIDEECQEMEENNSEDSVETEQKTKSSDNIKRLLEPKCGRDVVVYMIKCFHLCEMRLAYLNFTKRRVRDVYDLTVVQKSLLEPEHFIFSSFGIIHRYSDGTGIAMSLTDWYKESILYYALKCIPFVKNFLIKKYFQGWLTLTIKNKHLSVAKYLSKNLIPANVTFGKSILQILRLLDEISHVKFVPDQFLEIQTETSFMKNICTINKTADSYLETFYRYIKLMTNETAAELYKLLQFSQAQLHNIYLYSNDSIYLKKMKRKKREQCLQDSLYQVQKLGNFIRLINYMLNNKIVEITLNNIVILGELVCSLELDYMSPNPVKEAIFKTNIVITRVNDETALCASPGVKEMESIIFDVIQGIPKLILKHCYPLDGLLRSEYLMRYEKILSENQNEGNLHLPKVLPDNSEIKSLISKKKSNFSEKHLVSDLPFIELPKKSDDDLRVATPPKVNTKIFNGLSYKLVGQAIPSNFTPLTTCDVFDLLELNPLYKSLTAGFVDLFSESEKEMSDLCSQYTWLIDVRSEYNEWLQIDMSVNWANGTSSMFEQRLLKVRNFVQALESTERKLILSNKLFLVDFEPILDELLTEMNFEWETVSNFIFSSAKTKGLDFIEKIGNILKILHMRNLNAESLSTMACSIRLCKENSAEFERSVNNIKSLFEVLRVAGKDISEKDNTEFEVITIWESLKNQLQQAIEFLNDEKPNVLNEIKLRIKVMYKYFNAFKLSQEKQETFLKLTILTIAAILSFATRLFSVLRYESVIHEFDPYFNYRTTKYLSEEGFYKFHNWFDDTAWYPLGRIIGGTIYPGLMMTSAMFYNLLHIFNITIDIRNICVFLAPLFSSFTTIITYKLTTELKDSGAGLIAASLISVVPGYISRSVAGSYDNEGIAIFCMILTFYLWVKSVKTGSICWSALCSVAYFYMVSSWGGYVFLINVIPIHVLILMMTGRFNHQVYVAYSVLYCVGTVLSMQISFVGFLPVQSSEHMGALGVFGLCQIHAFVDYVRSRLTSDHFNRLFRALLLLIGMIVCAIGIVLAISGKVAPWTGRFYSLLDPSYAKNNIPIIASVSEHQPTAWSSFYFDLQFLTIMFPVGLYYCFKNLTNENIFIISYGIFSIYFAGVMVRLMLVLAPVMCILTGIAVSCILRTYIKSANLSQNISLSSFGFHSSSNGDTSKVTSTKASKKSSEDSSYPMKTEVATGIVVIMTVFLCLYSQHCIWVTSEAYSSPSIVLSARGSDNSRIIFDDFREAYYWLRQNTPENAKIMSWWDYGYQITAMANRTILVDNNTWNNTHISRVGQAMASNEDRAYPIMRQLDVDYVLIIFGGVTGYSSDDINKFLWMVRIGGSTPEGGHIKESDYYTPQGEFRVDKMGSETLLNCLMYKMSYYNFDKMYTEGGKPPGYDRVRNAEIGNKNFELETLEEAYTTEHWLVRIYKVKDLYNRGTI